MSLPAEGHRDPAAKSRHSGGGLRRSAGGGEYPHGPFRERGLLLHGGGLHRALPAGAHRQPPAGCGPHCGAALAALRFYPLPPRGDPEPGQGGGLSGRPAGGRWGGLRGLPRGAGGFPAPGPGPQRGPAPLAHLSPAQRPGRLRRHGGRGTAAGEPDLPDGAGPALGERRQRRRSLRLREPDAAAAGIRPEPPGQRGGGERWRPYHEHPQVQGLGVPHCDPGGTQRGVLPEGLSDGGPGAP